MRTIITILGDITETSMPFNEFVLYRASHFPEEKQILIVCGKKQKLPEVCLPDSLTILYAGRNPFRVRKTIQQVIRECRQAGNPFVFHLHQGKSGILAHLSMLGTSFRKKTVFTVHSTFSGYAFHNKCLSFLNGALSQRVICVSNTSLRAYPKVLKQFKKDRIRTILNGVDTERIDGMRDESCQTGLNTIRFIYVARMVPIKNHDFLLDVIQSCPENVSFVFVGAEDPEGRIRKRIEEEKLSARVELTGLIPRNEVFRRLQQSDVYLSSSTLEGLPISVLEAMYVGLPVILSDIPQHAEVTNNSEFATLLPLKQELWIGEIARYALLGKGVIKNTGEQARAYVAKHFSLGAMHHQYDAVYEGLL